MPKDESTADATRDERREQHDDDDAQVDDGKPADEVRVLGDAFMDTHPVLPAIRRFAPGTSPTAGDRPLGPEDDDGDVDSANEGEENDDAGAGVGMLDTMETIDVSGVAAASTPSSDAPDTEHDDAEADAAEDAELETGDAELETGDDVVEEDDVDDDDDDEPVDALTNTDPGLTLDDTAPLPLGDSPLEPEPPVSAHSFSRQEVTDHTRELPVLRAEELWFIHDQPPPALSPGDELEIDGHTILVLACVGVQTFERRYRVRLDGGPRDLLLKQGARDAPFVRYDLEKRALETVADEGPCPGLPSAELFWHDERCQYLVTELTSGRSFAHLLADERPPLWTCVEILERLAAIVRRLHNAGFILTSIRPTSFDVALSADGEVEAVLLTDLLNLCETVERPPFPLASPFTAPEITDQSPADEGADIYSIGALLYRLVTGVDVPSRRAGHNVFVPQRPAAQAPMVFQVLARTLSAPSERFFDIGELERALDQLHEELEPRLRVKVSMRSSTGINPLRTVNQDSGGFHEIRRVHRSAQTHLGYYCVADGMGGHEDGDRASELATEGAMRCFLRLALELDHEQWRQGCAAMCKRIAAAASRHLVETVQREGGGRRMGTTFTSVLVVDELIALAHLGDSRAILFRDDRLEVLSEDHSLVGMMVKAGQMTIEQAERADEKNILMRSLGADHVIHAELFDGFEATLGSAVFKARPDDRIILVSDGVWGMMDRPHMAEMFRKHPETDELCDALCNEAIRLGGGDNVVVLALDFPAAPRIVGAADERTLDDAHTLDTPVVGTEIEAADLTRG